MFVFSSEIEKLSAKIDEEELLKQLAQAKQQAAIAAVLPEGAQPGEMVEVNENDCLANVPYVEGCGLWFDHHSSEVERAGQGYILCSIGEESGEIPYTAYFAAESWLNENADTAQGFANAIASPAIEFRAEGLVTGTAVKMFSIAGPVIVYGMAAGVLWGVLWYFLRML